MSLSCPIYEKAKRTRALHLCSLQLCQIPQPVFNLTMLTRLDLSNNNISVLPPTISELTRLENLWVSNNPLKSLPPEVHLCKKLRVLDLRNTLVDSIPREIGRMQNLFSINLEGSPISDEFNPFSGNTEDLIAYLDMKDKRTNLANRMQNDLLANLYLEVSYVMFTAVVGGSACWPTERVDQVVVTRVI